ncbi:MAG: hypothetical protein WCJ36_00830 [Candidatus Saccharibacteria bacterium]
METQGMIGSATKSDELATWNRQRTTEQLISFIARREAEIANTKDDF